MMKDRFSLVWNYSVPEWDVWHKSLMDMNAERCAEFAAQAEKETDIPVQRDGNFPMCT